MEFFLLYKMYMYKWKYLIHYIKPLGALRGMLIIKRDFEKYRLLYFRITNYKSCQWIWEFNMSLTPICGMLNNYKEERRKMIRMVKEKNE